MQPLPLLPNSAPGTNPLITAWLLAKRRKQQPAQPVQPGMLTNEAGPQVQTNYPPNAWPSDGDHD